MSAAQEEQPWQFPSALRSELDSRLRQFTQAQAEGDWGKVPGLLGNYRRGLSGYRRYTPQHKTCLVETMKKSPMVWLDYRIQEGEYSSELLLTPPDRRWWTLVGDATFQTASELSHREVAIVAYRDGKEWFFTPPPIDNADLSATVTAQDLADDRKDSVEIHIPPDAPLAISDLHVHIDRKDIKSRNIEFRFRNQTDKKVIAYSFNIGDTISFGTGAEEDAIKPRGHSRVFKETYLAFLYGCEGEANIRITLEDVTFADGVTWSAGKVGSESMP
jgi:hypothetical protein